jgi:hypothetical protein
MPGVGNEHAVQKPVAEIPNAPTDYFAGSNSGLPEGCISGFVAGNEEGFGSVVAGTG